MDFDFSAEQYELRDEARRFLEERCPASYVRQFVDEPGSWSRDLWKQMADLGWTALPYPERYGGLGRSFLDLALLFGELGRALAPVPFLSSVALAGISILHHGSEEQRERWLPAIVSGDRIGVFARRFGGDPVEVSAERTDDGWILSGSVSPVLDAPAADLFVVPATDADRTRLFVVEDAHVTSLVAYDRTRAIGAVRFERAPAEPLEEGWTRIVLCGVAAACAEMVGVAQKVLEMSVTYAKEREQFGRPIGSFQAIKHKLAEMATELEAARAAAYYACWAVDSGAEDASVAASIAKSYCSDALAHLGGEAVQVHGGIAFTWEHDMHLYLRRLKSLQVLFGDASYHRERIAKQVGL